MASNGILARVLYSFAGNVLRAGLSFVTGILLARGMGPEVYGVFGFLLASFTAMTQLLDMGSSNAFLTFISKRTPSRRYLLYYAVWQLLQFCLLLAFIALLASDEVIESLWHGEDRQRILIAFVGVFLQQKVWLTITQIGESQRFTKRIQLVSVLIALIHLAIVVVLMWLDRLDIELVYIIIAIEFCIGAALTYWWLPLQFNHQVEPFKSVCSEYYSYCLPLIPMVWVSVASVFLDTWLLQKYGGSVEQAYYAVAVQFSVISLLATRSVLNILWKEVAEAYAQEQRDVVILLFNRSARMLHHLGAFVSGMLIPWTAPIIILTLGEEYLGGALAMAIMFLYPIDQARGQVAGTMLLAMEKTQITSLVSVASNIIGLVVAYLLMAPAQAIVPGMELGAVGLAVKMVGVQLLTVNSSLWIISRILQTPMNWSYQFVSLIAFLTIGYGCFYITIALLGQQVHFIWQFLLGGILYVTTTLLFVYLLPGWVGFTKEQFVLFAIKLFQFIGVKSGLRGHHN